MDPRMYNAAMKGAMKYDDFSLDEHLKREEENGYQVTPNGNTILHVATLFGHRGFIREVLKVTPGLLCYSNKKKETALHIAANVGQSEVVHELLSIRGEETILVRMKDNTGDTALHKAVRGGHLEIVRMLVRLLDPEFDFLANDNRETPLYLAAESGFHDALIEIMNVCKKPTNVAGPSKRTPLHAAIIQEHEGCARLLWQWNKHLCEAADECGWNSLHYAVKQGLKNLVSDMLEWKKSLAYIPAGYGRTTAFHIAASEGDILMIQELLLHCPDCWDMVNGEGQNALHVAILNHQEMSVHALLELPSCNGLVDEADNVGNTPLHLLAANWNHLPKLILDHPRAKKVTYNNRNDTPLDIALSDHAWTINKEKLAADLCSINGRLGQRDFPKNRKIETMRKIEQMREEEEKAKRDKIEREKIMKSAQIQKVVATLVLTVTLVAGFTLEGGLESDDCPNKGTAILLKRAAFRAFVISDVLAFICSAGAIFIYFSMADINIDENNELGSCKVLPRFYNIAFSLQLLGMCSVVVAFVTGMYAT